ncbi:hypothetical protein HYV89_01010 [Candidatus Woesearchaeota archaeon]|nr:hypothetical protein [Candidatus Woesearchaeota archaeon]
MEMVVNVDFKNVNVWKDSIRRVRHIKDRMKLSGIFVVQIKDAVQKGAKKLRNDGSMVAEYRWFKVIYREFQLEDIRKIYPITVMEA